MKSPANITPVLMPKWGLSMTEGLLSDWLVEEGTSISIGDEIMEVETDKIASAVEATDEGVLRRCVAVAGETYPVRALMGVLAAEEVNDADIDAFIDAYEVPQAEDDEDAETGTVAVRALVRALNALLAKAAVNERLVPLVPDDSRELYVGVTEEGAMTLLQGGCTELSAVAALREFASW